MSSQTQPDPAEGARDDDAAKTATQPRPGQSSDKPAEGGDDAPAAGSPRG